VAAGLLAASGAVEVRALRGRVFPELRAWAPMGAVLVAGAIAGAWCLARGRRTGLVASVGCAGVALAALAGGGALAAVDAAKAARPLARSLPADQLCRDVRVGAFGYFQPSMVFYCGRQVERVEGEAMAIQFLRGPLPSYLFVPAEQWRTLRGMVDVPAREVARHRDLYAGREIVLVSNEREGGD
jgi:hypothetical protein